MAIDYSFPAWMLPKHAPWEALVAGVQAGSQIAANRQRGRQLAAQIDHQQFEETVLRQKADADAQDLKTLQEWWPSFSNAQGDGLKTLQVPPLKNSQMWNHITMEVERKKQQSAASEFANIASTVDASTPEGQAALWRASRGMVPPEHISQIIERQTTAKRNEKAALETARYHDLMAGKTPQKANLAEAQRLERIADALEPIDAEEAQRYRKDADVMRASIPTAAGVVGDVTTSTKSAVQQRMLSSSKSMDLGSQLLSNLTPSDVGVAGAFNQVVVNEGLSQLFPSLYKEKVTDARTLLGIFRENAIKAIRADTGPISNKDFERYEEILPKLGKVESFQSVQDKIRTFMQKFQEQTRTDAKAVGKPIPTWALTPEEIKSKKELGELSYDDAAQLLIKYHGYKP